MITTTRQREDPAERFTAMPADPACFRLHQRSLAIASGSARLHTRHHRRRSDAVQPSTALQAGMVALICHTRHSADCNDLPNLSARA